MKIKTILNFTLISIILFFNQIVYSDGPDNLRNEIFYVVFKDNVPYVICNHKDRLYKIQSILLYNQLNSNLPDFDLKLELDKSNRIIVPGPCLEFNSKGNEIKGNKYAIDELFGFFNGDKLVIQKVVKDSLTPRLTVTIDKVIYYTYMLNSSVIFRCLPLDSNCISQLKRDGRIDNIFAFYKPNLKNTTLEYYKTEILPIPLEVEKKVNEFAKSFLPSSDPNKYPYPYKYISSIRYTDFNGKKHFYYAALLSYGEKGKESIFYLLNNKGIVIQIIKGEEYSRIIGILETDKRSAQSIVISYGGYGGGIKVLSFKRYPEKQPVLETKLSIATFCD